MSCFSSIIYVIFATGYQMTEHLWFFLLVTKEKRRERGLAGIFFPLTDQDCVLHNYSMLQGSWKINPFLLYSPL